MLTSSYPSADSSLPSSPHRMGNLRPKYVAKLTRYTRNNDLPKLRAYVRKHDLHDNLADVRDSESGDTLLHIACSEGYDAVARFVDRSNQIENIVLSPVHAVISK